MKLTILLTLSAAVLFGVVSASPFYPQVSVGAALFKRGLSDDEGDVESPPNSLAASSTLAEGVLEKASQWTEQSLELSSQFSHLQIEGDGCHECKAGVTERQGSECLMHQLLSTAIKTGHSPNIQETFAKAAAADKDVSAAPNYSEEELDDSDPEEELDDSDPEEELDDSDPEEELDNSDPEEELGAVEKWIATALQLLRALQHANIKTVGDEYYLGCFECKHPEGGDGAPQHKPGCELHAILAKAHEMGRGLSVNEVSEQLGAMNLQPNENSTGETDEDSK